MYNVLAHSKFLILIREYWVLELCPSSGILKDTHPQSGILKRHKRIQSFGNGIYFHPQVRAGRHVN
jgi:hypothetical protein